MHSYKELKIKSKEEILITPQKAKVMLEKNHYNRQLNQSVIMKYSTDMLKGRWCLTHQGIALDETGKICDGQHRLEAIVRADKPIKMLVITYQGELDPSMLLPFDIGKNRSIHDLTGLSIREIAIYRAILTLFPSIQRKTLTPVECRYMSENTQVELEQLSKISGMSHTYSASGRNGLTKVWVGAFKAVCIAAIIEGIDLSDIEEFSKGDTKKKYIKEFQYWHSFIYGTVNAKHANMVVLPMLWSIIKHKKFIDNDYDALDKNRAELRKIFIKKYPEVLS